MSALSDIPNKVDLWHNEDFIGHSKKIVKFHIFQLKTDANIKENQKLILGLKK